MNTKCSRGFSLIELLLVLGVLAILLVAAFVVYPQVRDRNQANAEIANLTAIKASITNLYASRGGNYGGLRVNVANQARVFPASMNGGDYGASANVVSSWGGLVVVGAATGPTSAVPNGDRRYSIRYTNVPAGVCLGFASGAAGNFDQISIGTTLVITNASGAALPSSAGGQFNPGLAASACTEGTYITFTTN